jgi:hypothetical protein
VYRNDDPLARALPPILDFFGKASKMIDRDRRIVIEDARTAIVAKELVLFTGD